VYIDILTLICILVKITDRPPNVVKVFVTNSVPLPKPLRFSADKTVLPKPLRFSADKTVLPKPLRFSADKTVCRGRYAPAQINPVAAATLLHKQTLLLSLRIRTEKAQLLSLRIRTDKPQLPQLLRFCIDKIQLLSLR